MKYKTRAQVEPQGKPNVYFCCHPDDFDKYFECISDDILSKQNCAIWYLDGAASYDDDFFLSLSQMQLFVMPVTTNLLCTENATLDVEFSFAINNHIPILPLMQEADLITLFNQKCGELQYLDKSECDITTASYDEKLEKYLSCVLIGDELAERIRSAFDAYVFLSYRKKDRKYAQELMHLIHKNAFCRDIAIWYDEFLTPGENFNDAILAALQKSDLFVLAVTPNLINEPNYIMSTEYPLAVCEDKPILPAELVPTDHVQLSAKYKNIPVPANAYNDAELSDALLSLLKRIAIKENNQSPEHNFFIGLAYLSGIDVEIDYERALKLIISAADCGLVEAMKKLVTIYHKGIGVKRNILSAITWQEKVVASYNLKNEAHYTDVITLGKLCVEAGHYQQAKEVFSLLPMLGAKTLQGKLQIAVAIYELANIELDTAVFNADKFVGKIKPGTNNEAIRRYEESLSLFDTIATLDDNVSACKNVIYLRFADVYYRIGDLLNAKNHLIRVIEDTDLEQIKEDDIQYKAFLDAHFLLGDVMIAQDNKKMAEKYYRLAFNYSEKGRIFFGDDYAEKQKGKYYQKIATMFLKIGDVDNAISNCSSAIEIRLLLAQKLDLHGLWQDLADSNEFMSKLYESQGNMQMATLYLAEAQSSSARSVKKTDSPQQLEKFAFTTSRYIALAERGLIHADVLKMTEKQKGDKTDCEDKLRSLFLAVRANNSEDTWLEIVKCYRLLAEIYADIKDYEAAAHVYAKAADVLTSRHEEFSSLKMLGLLSRIYIRIGKMYSNLFMLDTCLDYEIKGAKILEQIQTWFQQGISTLSTPDSANTDEAIEKITNSAKAGYISAIEWLVSSYRNGNYVKKDLEQAIVWQKALCDRLRENYPYKISADNLAEYAYAVKARASLHEEAGDMASAIRYYKFALDIYKDISNLYRNQNKMPDAKKYLLDALSLLETIVTKRTDAYKNNPIDTGTKELLTQDANEISSIVIELQEVHCEKVIDKTTIAQRTVNFFARMAQILPAVYNPLYGMHCFNLAELLYDTKKFTEAEHAYLLAISIYEKCIPDNPTYHFSVAESYNNLAVMYHDNEQYDKAEAMHRKALEVRQYCASEWSSKYADKVLALSYMNLGILLFDIKQYEESKQMYLHAVDLYTKVENFYSVAKLHARIGDLYRVMKQPLESASHFHAAIGICEQNMASDPEGFTPILADAHDGLSFLYEKEADLARSAKEATAAKEAALCYPAHPICKRILKRNCY